MFINLLFIYIILPLNLISSNLKKNTSRQIPLGPKIFPEGTSFISFLLFSSLSSKLLSSFSESLESSINGFGPNFFWILVIFSALYTSWLLFLSLLSSKIITINNILNYIYQKGLQLHAYIHTYNCYILFNQIYRLYLEYI